jgi:N-terminal acetyltransferase B complex non-catalytic subunit
MQHCFGNGLEAKDRPLQLTYIKLRQQIGVSMLSDCKDYFQHHSHLNSCFNDLKPIACRLSAADFKEFMKFTLTWTTELLGGSETSVRNLPDLTERSWWF